MSYANDSIIYNTPHSVDVVGKNGSTAARHTMITLSRTSSCLQMKVRDPNDFSFNFTADVNWNVFEKMKAEQYLEICYEEFHLRLVDLLKQALSKEMYSLLRLDIVSDAKSRLVFYEKSRIKSLIFLMIELISTDQNEVINEMAADIVRLKEANETVNSQLSRVRHQLQEKDSLLSSAVTANGRFKSQFRRDVEAIEVTFGKILHDVERNICAQMEKLNARHGKLLLDLASVRRENDLKQNAFVHTLRQLEHAKRDNEKHVRAEDVLKREISDLNLAKLQSDRIVVDLRQSVANKDGEIEALNKRAAQLQKDVDEAAVVIARKTRSQDEIAKDLVQANTMLVNFNNQYDIVSKELDRLRDVVIAKEKTVREQSAGLKKMSEDFGKYRLEYNEEIVGAARHELLVVKQKLSELEKRNREAAKINALLTKKLTNDGGVFDSRNSNWIQPPK